MADLPANARSPSRVRRRRRQSVADLEELFHLLIENVRDYAIFILAPDGRALTWNAGVERMLGYAEQNFIGLEFGRLFRPAEREAATEEMKKAASTGRSDDERWHVRKDGGELWITGVLTALRDPVGNLRGYVKIMRDTTAQRHAELEREDLLRRELVAREQAERANRIKDEFLAIVSHELRTPLNAILGWARMLADGQLDARRAKRALETIERNARAQAQLVADLLDVSRVATGKLQLNLQPVSLQDLMKATYDSVHHAANAKDVRISMSTKGDPAPIEGDPERLQQVLLNLLGNAIKFTPSGGSIELQLERRERDIELRVRDTGQGIAADVLPRVFDRFQQGANGGAHAGGLGLGLTIARHIVEAHLGSIEAYSDGEGKGATFIVRLPQAFGLSSIADPSIAKSPRLEIEGFPELHGRGALVVEDQPDSQELAAFILSRCGLRVFTADSVERALALLREHPVDIIVSDIRLAGDGDGFELIRAVRAQPDPVGHVPAIVVSAHANVDDQTRALEAGYELHVSKPVEPAELIAAVSSLLRKADASTGSRAADAD
jgi:PAS domain S-box-containing protein